jgi:hypothetical protein
LVFATTSLDFVFNSDADINIPISIIVNYNGIALIIRKWNLRYAMKLDFAIKDGLVMKRYLTLTMDNKKEILCS